MRSGALLVSLELVVALPYHTVVLVGGMPDLGAEEILMLQVTLRSGTARTELEISPVINTEGDIIQESNDIAGIRKEHLFQQ